MKKFVYIAGPITLGQYWVNVRNGVDVGHAVRKAGMIPFIPHLDFLWVFLHPEITWEENLQYDEQVILRCQAVLRMPGESKGADREVEFANEHGIPVFHSLEALVAWNDTVRDPEFYAPNTTVIGERN